MVICEICQMMKLQLQQKNVGQFIKRKMEYVDIADFGKVIHLRITMSAIIVELGTRARKSKR